MSRSVMVVMREQFEAWSLGGIAHDPHRVPRIAAAQDWHRLMTPKLDDARTLYDRIVAPDEPLSDSAGWIDGSYYHATRAELRAVWRERKGQRV